MRIKERIIMEINGISIQRKKQADNQINLQTRKTKSQRFIVAQERERWREGEGERNDVEP